MKRFLLTILAVTLLLCGCVGTSPEKNPAPSYGKKAPAPSTKDTSTEETTPVSSLNGKIILIDPGHGLFSSGRQEAIAPGSSQTKPAFVSGTSGKNQTEEQLNLAVSLKLRDKLLEQGAIVYMTRDTHETTRSNIDRAEYGNSLNADMVVKIHADGSSNSGAHGTSVLVPGGQYISDSSLIEKSRTAGELILQEFVAATGSANRGISVRNDMTGFNWSTVPVVLVEMGFMSNPEEDALMETDAYQDKMVMGITNGLILYFK